MFAKNSSLEIGDNKDVETIIGASVKVEGNFICQGSVIIEGAVNGVVETSGMLQVGSKAVITANVKAESATIAGKIKGNITIINQLELASTAEIEGDIETGNLTINKGAKFNGKCTMSAKNAINSIIGEKITE